MRYTKGTSKVESILVELRFVSVSNEFTVDSRLVLVGVL